MVLIKILNSNLSHQVNDVDHTLLSFLTGTNIYDREHHEPQR